MEQMFTQALNVYLLSVKWLRERRFLRNCWMLSICQLSLLSPSLTVTLDAAKMFELRLGEKPYLRHCLRLPVQEILSVHKLSLFIFFESSGVANKVDVEFFIIEFYSWSGHWDEWGYAKVLQPFCRHYSKHWLAVWKLCLQRCLLQIF